MAKAADGNGFTLETAGLEELEEMRQKIDARAAALRAERRETVMAQVRELLASIGETPEGLARGARRPAGGQGGGSGKKAAAASGGIVAAKYRDPASGQTWTGRGKQPVWLRDKLAGGASLEDFAV